VLQNLKNEISATNTRESELFVDLSWTLVCSHFFNILFSSVSRFDNPDLLFLQELAFTVRNSAVYLYNQDVSGPITITTTMMGTQSESTCDVDMDGYRSTLLSWQPGKTFQVGEHVRTSTLAVQTRVETMWH